MRRTSDSLHQGFGIGQGVCAGGEPRQGIGQNLPARQAERIHRAGRDDQGMRRIQSAGDADDDFLNAGMFQTLDQALRLDVENFTAMAVAYCGIGWNVGETIILPLA